jgi:assimilatory nitrate reductase catalytic subunit
MPRGEAKTDFEIFRYLSQRWGCGEMFREWSSPEAVFQILKRCSVGQPCDLSGIRDYQELEELGGVQWPCPESAAEIDSERRLFADGKFFTANQRANFLFDPPQPMSELPDAEFPLILLTGRGSSAQWHTETRTSKSAILRKLHAADLWVEIHPRDAANLNIKASDWVTVQSRRGQVRARARISATVQPGHVFLPMHHREVNTLTHGSFDPHSRQPSYKACAVRAVI